MAKRSSAPRKQRTRQHIVEDLSIHYVEGFVLNEGHIVQRVDKDYGYDLFLFTFDQHGYAEHGCVFLQLKAAESLQMVGTDYVFDLDIRDYNRWIREELPVILILFDASRKRAYWLPVQKYFGASTARRPKPGAKTVRVRVPGTQTVNRRAIATMRELKDTELRRGEGDNDTN